MFSSMRFKIMMGLGVSLVGLGSGYVLKKSLDFGFCLVSQPTCINNLTLIGNSFFYGMGALAVVFAILFVFPKSFSSWRKFAIWAIPAIIVLFSFYRDPRSGDLFSPYAEQVHMFVSKLFVLVSVVIIAIADFKAHKKGKKS